MAGDQEPFADRSWPVRPVVVHFAGDADRSNRTTLRAGFRRLWQSWRRRRRDRFGPAAASSSATICCGQFEGRKRGFENRRQADRAMGRDQQAPAPSAAEPFQPPSMQAAELFVAVDDDHRWPRGWKEAIPSTRQAALSVVQGDEPRLPAEGFDRRYQRGQQRRFAAAVRPDDFTPPAGPGHQAIDQIRQGVDASAKQKAEWLPGRTCRVAKGLRSGWVASVMAVRLPRRRRYRRAETAARPKRLCLASETSAPARTKRFSRSGRHSSTGWPAIACRRIAAG